MRNFLFFSFVILLLGLASCGSRPNASASSSEVPIIDVEAAMADLQDGLKLSDFGSRVRYVPLETSDSCLIGRTQWALWSERGLLVPSSSRNEVRMYSFDMETGRFITNVGHRGEDPKGYKGTLPYYNGCDSLLYFGRRPNQLQKYDYQGNYHGKIALSSCRTLPYSLLWSDSLWIGYHEAREKAGIAKGRLLSIFSPDGTLVDTVARPYVFPDYAGREIVRIGTFWIANFGMISLEVYKDGKVSGSLTARQPLWRCDGCVRIKDSFNDTIYSLGEGNVLCPTYVFDYGDKTLDEASRLKGQSDGKFVTVGVLETSGKIYFLFVDKLFETAGAWRPGSGKLNFEVFAGIYDKLSGTVQVAPIGEGVVDDINGFLPFTPRFCGPHGEFVDILQAYEVVEWLEAHPEAKDNPRLAPLLKVKEEDNPVVVIVSDK